jgi:SAM-dependent methyltransferase
MWYRFYTMIRMIRGRGLSILDIGAGDGDIAFTLARQGHTVSVLDISKFRLEKYKDQARDLGITQLHGNVQERIPVGDKTQDAVLCGEVIEHVPENDGAMQEIRRVLKAGGQLIVSVPYRESLKMMVCPHCGREFELNGHLHTYDESVLSNLFQSHGFTVTGWQAGHTRVSRLLWMIIPMRFLLPLYHVIDRLTYRSLRASDTWVMMKGIRHA